MPDGDAYHAFLAGKVPAPPAAGLAVVPPLHPAAFPHQAFGTSFALQRGRAALFYDAGLGKTLSQVEFCRVAAEETGRPALILAPLAVAQQTVREMAERFGREVRLCRGAGDVGPGVNIANYDRLGAFDAEVFGAVSLDESSILKNFVGKTRVGVEPASAGPRPSHLSLGDLRDGDCRFPIGDPGKPGFHFCGEPALPGSSYCGPHHAVCWSGNGPKPERCGGAGAP